MAEAVLTAAGTARILGALPESGAGHEESG